MAFDSKALLLSAGLLSLTVVPIAVAATAAEAATAAGDEMVEWFNHYGTALAEARRTGKPIFLEFRCAP